MALRTAPLDPARGSNPDIPEWLAQDYRDSWDQLFELAMADLGISEYPITLRSILGVATIYRNSRYLGEILITYDESEPEEIYKNI